MKLSVILLLLLGHSAGALALWTASDIRSLQERLKENQFYSGPITGVLDRDTELAIARATADFPEIEKLKADRREYFVAQILSWYNNAFELKAAQSNKDGRSRHLQIKETQLPAGRFRHAFREDGASKHIEHVHELIISPGRHLELSEEFINHSNPDMSAKGSISGTYRIVRWFKRSQDTVFFYVTAKSGDVWTAREFMSLAQRGGLKNLPIGFSVRVFDDNVIAVNGDKFVRVSAR